MSPLPLLQVKKFSYAYPAPGGGSVDRWALEDISFEVHRGGSLAVMGPSGAGKSTLALAIMGIIPQSYGGRIRGRVQVDGLDTRSTTVVEVARRVGLVFENPESQFLMTRVEDEIAFGLENLALPPDDIQNRMDRVLATLGLSGFQSRTPRSLSGGEKQRVALAAILAMQPRLLVLDEPAARLDHEGTQGLRSALDNLRSGVETSLIIISNNSDWIARLTDHTMILNEGRQLRYGPTLDVLGDQKAMAAAGLKLPTTTLLSGGLSQAGIDLEIDSFESAPERISDWLIATSRERQS